MHRKLLATGSYNWTRSAEVANCENLVLLDDPDLVARFDRKFQRLWREAAERAVISGAISLARIIRERGSRTMRA